MNDGIKASLMIIMLVLAAGEGILSQLHVQAWEAVGRNWKEKGELMEGQNSNERQLELSN